MSDPRATTAELAASSYGKARVRLTRVERHADRHDLHQVTVNIRLAGDYGAAYTEGDNRDVLPTDTMKNTVYALARRQPFAHVEELGLRLGRHFLGRAPKVERVFLDLAEQPWTRMTVDGAPHPHAFVGGGGEEATASVAVDRERETVVSGLRGLAVLKTTGSGFAGFFRDEYTTLPETGDRILATLITASWRCRGAGDGFDYGALRKGVRERLLAAFAGHDSRSVQHTLYAMGEAVLAAHPELLDIHLSLPNQHHLPVDLAPLGLDNPNLVFVPVDEPHGVIEATVRRRAAG